MLRNKPFCNHYQRCAPTRVGLFYPLGDLPDADTLLRNKDGVGSGSHAGMQCDPANVTAHHLNDHAPVVRFSSRAKPVDRFRGDLHCGVETEGVIRGVKVIVHSLRDAHDLQSGVGQAFGRSQGSLTADRNDRIDAQAVHMRLDDLRPAAVLKGVGAGGAENGAALLGDTTDQHAGNIDDVTLNHTPPAVKETDKLVAVDGNALQHGAADNGVQSGAVAAAGENSNFHVSAQILNEGFSPGGGSPGAESADFARSGREYDEELSDPFLDVPGSLPSDGEDGGRSGLQCDRITAVLGDHHPAFKDVNHLAAFQELPPGEAWRGFPDSRDDARVIAGERNGHPHCNVVAQHVGKGRPKPGFF
jgi:hypothetical protein